MVSERSRTSLTKWLPVLLVLGLAPIGFVVWLDGANHDSEFERRRAKPGTALADRANPALRVAKKSAGKTQRANTNAAVPALAVSATAISVAPAASASTRVVRDPDLAWSHPGQCRDAARPGLDAQRAAYLSKFLSVADWYRTLYVHPDVPEAAHGPLTSNLPAITSTVTSRLELAADPPDIYLYPNVEVLREYSCASPHAVAYYDGSIHLAVLPVQEAVRSLTHEYVHHVLMSNGIGKPFWFQEGAAMELANDLPHGYWTVWRRNPISLERMVNPFPKTGNLDRATAYYAQAYVMMEFLQSLCDARVGCGIGKLANALASGRVAPEALFEWATAERGRDLMHTTRVTLWDDYVKQGSFPGETLAALLDRKPSFPVDAEPSRGRGGR